MHLSPDSGQQNPEYDAPQTEQLARALAKQFKAYRADPRLSTLQLLVTLIPFAFLLAVMGTGASRDYPIALILAFPAAGLLVRLFIIQHDCGHGSFFRSRVANDALGRALSILTLTPYASWKQGHAAHHASTGNLDRRGRGDVDTWTVAEYRDAASYKRLIYRVYRNPFVMVGIGAPINFVLLQRLPLGRSFRDQTRRSSILGLDLALLIVFGTGCAVFGSFNVLATYLPVIVIASWIGNWLFYVQHQFEGTHWQRDGDWDFYQAALSGSSYFKLPKLLQWFSGNIGLHHVHHICSRVPNYLLQACVDAAPDLHRAAKIVTLRESLGCWRLALWDEQRGVLVGFREQKLGR